MGKPLPVVPLGVHMKREKMFGFGRCIPLDRNAKARILVYARGWMRRTEPGKAYGEITAKFYAVLQSLLYDFHNAASGKCFPAYETIADRAGCSRTTVYNAIHVLEDIGLLDWVHRLIRIRVPDDGVDLFGRPTSRWRVVRTSNGYSFRDPQPSKSNFQTGTAGQKFRKIGDIRKEVPLDSENPLHRALMALGKAVADSETAVGELFRRPR
jgi:hypothetical protein